jgi:UDP-N-acetylmuramate dehydrogenase
MPRYLQVDGAVKLAAGWLIEHAGVKKGERRGAVGVSSRHALALVHHGGASSDELIALARSVRDRVRAEFGVALVPEPVFVGFARDFAL